MLEQVRQQPGEVMSMEEIQAEVNAVRRERHRDGGRWHQRARVRTAFVSGDKDLLTLKSFAGIPIIDAAEAVARLGG